MSKCMDTDELDKEHINETKCELILCSSCQCEIILHFLESVDNLFPNPISNRIPLTDFIDKLLTYGKIYGMFAGDRLIGCAFFYCNDETGKIAFLTMLAVAKEYQHCGVGGKLLAKAEEVSRKYGMTSMTLKANTTNAGAIALYRKHGYDVIEEVTDGSENKYLMIKKL